MYDLVMQLPNPINNFQPLQRPQQPCLVRLGIILLKYPPFQKHAKSSSSLLVTDLYKCNTNTKGTRESENQI